MESKFLVKVPEIIDYIPGETQIPNSREYIDKTLADISEELTEKLHTEGLVSGMDFARRVKERLYGEDFREVPYLDTDICYEQYKEAVIDPLSGQTYHISTAGFDRSTMLDIMLEQLGRRAGLKMFLNYIYGIDPADVKHQSWEILISPLWSETVHRVRPIDIRKGGWKCRRRTSMGSILALTAGTKMSIQ